MKPFLRIITIYSIILFIFLLVHFWFLSYPNNYNIPEYIPHMPISIGGLTIFCVFLPLMIFALKAILRKDPQIGLLKLYFIGFIICSVPELLLQIIRASTFETDRLLIFIKGFWGSTFIFAIVVFFIAYQLKTKNTARLLLFVFAFILLCNAVKYIFPDFL